MAISFFDWNNSWRAISYFAATPRHRGPGAIGLLDDSARVSHGKVQSPEVVATSTERNLRRFKRGVVLWLTGASRDIQRVFMNHGLKHPLVDYAASMEEALSTILTSH